MNDKELIVKLFKIVANQQKAIVKMAQAVDEGVVFAKQLKNMLNRKFPGLNVTDLSVTNFATKYPTLTMTADLSKVPTAALKGFLTEQFLLQVKKPAALFVNGTDINV